ncbi:hypothetical protein J4402_02640 [Candidatus Pacearchaeota archaeon]|nr:hypothetical protein [Candidatus Pacearchaeota archaeon]
MVNYTPVEVIALIFIIFALVKMIVLIVSPSAWIKLTKKIWANASMMRLVGLVLAVVVLFFLLTEMTIVQIVAAAVFMALLAMVGLASEVEFLLKKYRARMASKSFWKEHWLYALIWLVLIIWTGKELLM